MNFGTAGVRGRRRTPGGPVSPELRGGRNLLAAEEPPYRSGSFLRRLLRRDQRRRFVFRVVLQFARGAAATAAARYFVFSSSTSPGRSCDGHLLGRIEQRRCDGLCSPGCCPRHPRAAGRSSRPRSCPRPGKSRWGSRKGAGSPGSRCFRGAARPAAPAGSGTARRDVRDARGRAGRSDGQARGQLERKHVGGPASGIAGPLHQHLRGVDSRRPVHRIGRHRDFHLCRGGVRPRRYGDLNSRSP